MVHHRNAITLQAAKDASVRESQDALFEIFERLEAFFQRLETYTEVAPDQRMVDTVTKIMVDVLNVLAITTNEIKQSWMSKPLLYKYVAVNGTILREIPKEPDQEY